MHELVPTTYDPHTLQILPTVRDKYLPAYPYRIVHWYRSRRERQSPQDGGLTLGHYRTRAEAEQALSRLIH